MPFCLFCIATCLLTQQPSVPEQLSVAEVVDRWDAGSRLIESYDLTIELLIDSRTVKLRSRASIT